MSYCAYCGKSHPTTLCPHTYGGSAARKNLRCTYCGSDKHSATYCLKTYAGLSNRRQNPNGDFID